ncbi:MAG: TAXI family TRAP transporter solute-binding subunit [Rickettsiales bacterium]
MFLFLRKYYLATSYFLIFTLFFVLSSIVTIAFGYSGKDINISIVTGLKTGTYYAFARDISSLVKGSDINVNVKDSEGSIDNIRRLNSNEKVSLGFIQSDILGFLKRSKNPDSMKMAKNLRVVFPLYDEEIHVLANKKIKSFSDLNGKKIAIGDDGSGNMLTSINLFSITGVKPAESVKISSAKGVVKVLKGELDAVIFVGGKPIRLFKNLEDLTLPENKKYTPMLDNVHFVPLNGVRLLEEYIPSEITSKDYSFVKESVPTVAVRAFLISYDFSANDNEAVKERCDNLNKLSKIIANNIEILKRKGHPKWREVDLNADVNIWQKDSCVWENPTELNNIISGRE